MKINLQAIITMKRSRRELCIDIVIRRDTFKYNQITIFPRFTLPNTGVSFYNAKGVNITNWIGDKDRFTLITQ